MKNTRLLIFLLASIAAVLIVASLAGLVPGLGGGASTRPNDEAASARHEHGDVRDSSKRPEPRADGTAMEASHIVGRSAETDADNGTAATAPPELDSNVRAIGRDDHDGTAGSGKQARITAIAIFRGTPPVPRKIKMTPECGKDPILDREVVVREDGALANVVVRVIDGLPHGEGRGEIGAEVVQERCEYMPRVSAMLAGQSLRVTSRDDFLHNVHSFDRDRSIFNKGQPVPSSFVKEFADLGVKEGPITLKCDVHPWMVSYVIVHTNPYFGVTGESGTATLLTPPGELTIEAWHERYGAKTRVVRVKQDEAVELAFEFP